VDIYAPVDLTRPTTTCGDL